jgi:NAD(P)-dependent dehydrogenase (short-subunit alcohol dehydrogenase family)
MRVVCQTQLMKSNTAIVTGSNRGIGHAIAKRFAAAGMNVVLCARDTLLLEEAVQKIEQDGGTAAAISLDLREANAGGTLVNFAIEQFGHIDMLVNNAGATKRGDFETLTDEDWADGFALKFFGAVRTTRAAWPHLKKSRGSVLMISGSGGRTPGSQFTIGGSVNAGLLSLTKALAEQGLRDGIQVNAINPGLVRTDRFRKRLAAVCESEGIDAAAAERKLVETENITRVGEPEDIANLAAFVMSPEGRFLHGALIDMDGGNTKTI